MTPDSGATDWTRENRMADMTSDQSGAGTAQPGEIVKQTAQQAQAATGQLADQAKQQITDQLHTQKERTSGSLSSVADALRQASKQLEDQGQAPVSNAATRAADGIERVANYLNDRDINALRYDAERLARNQPVVFLAGAFALGWLGARFFKSGSQGQSSSQGVSNYGGSPYPGSGYGSGVYTTYGRDRMDAPVAATPSTQPAGM